MGELSPGTRWRIVNGLGVYVLMMYGIAYYAVTTAAPSMAAELGVGVSVIFGMFSASLLAASLTAPFLGRWTDRIGSGTILLIGAVLRPLALVVMAFAPDLYVFALAMLIVQLLAQATEYDAAFAAAVHATGEGARVAISQITLWGGVASTVFWPVTAFLLDHLGWRHTLLALAALLLAVCGPIAMFLRHVTRGAAGVAPARELGPAVADAPRVVDLRFILLAAAFAFGGVAYNLPALMLPVLEGLGLGGAAIVAGMIFGPSQTAGRFSEMLFGQRLHATAVAIIASSMVVISLLVLSVAQGPVTAVAFAVLFGAGAGVSYVVRGSVVLALYGPSHYATWLGRLASVRMIISAAGPFLLTVVLESFGALGVVAACATAAILSLLCFGVLGWVSRS